MKPKVRQNGSSGDMNAIDVIKLSKYRGELWIGTESWSMLSHVASRAVLCNCIATRACSATDARPSGRRQK